MCDDCEWSDLLDEIEDMLSDDEYSFAADTLQGIYDWIEEHEHCTQGQIEAVHNIYGSKQN